MSASRDLAAEARAMAANTPPVLHHSTTWTPANSPEAVALLIELADEVEALTDRLNNQVVRRRTAERTIGALWKSRWMWRDRYERRDHLARLDRVASREALSAARAQLDAVRALATEWAREPFGSERFEQVEDGRALLAILNPTTQETPA